MRQAEIRSLDAVRRGIRAKQDQANTTPGISVSDRLLKVSRQMSELSKILRKKDG